jgi:Cys-tRNA(Pro)/Cys-tRNA(Cys) deacylase
MDIIPLVTGIYRRMMMNYWGSFNNDIIKHMLPSHTYLNHLLIPYHTASFSPSTLKGAVSVALALGLTERQTVKTLIFDTGKEERVLIMVSGDMNVISGHIKKVVGSRNVQLATPDSVIATTGYKIGSIPPFSWQPEGFRSFLDLELMSEVLLAVGAGTWGHEILITPANLIKASKALVVNLTNREKPIYP